ncbi:hypothetical protein [Streptomyces sp. NPDC001389]|uniref:hypothetical protein n=1 Tax=Streptomyces sp. NPDC001389 TaxID=3364569 RepID=UPI0036C19E74
MENTDAVPFPLTGGIAVEKLIRTMTQDDVWRRWVEANSTQAAKDGCISASPKEGCISLAGKSGCIS